MFPTKLMFSLIFFLSNLRNLITMSTLFLWQTSKKVLRNFFLWFFFFGVTFLHLPKLWLMIFLYKEFPLFARLFVQSKPCHCSMHYLTFHTHFYDNMWLIVLIWFDWNYEYETLVYLFCCGLVRKSGISLFMPVS